MKKLRVLAELIRLPNAFTACADILAGYWLAEGRLMWSGRLALLLVATVCLYSAGIVLNDICDLEVDRRERPNRPLPSERVGRRGARMLTAVLIIIGLGAAAASGGGLPARWMAPLPVALALVAAIIVYDCLLKDTLLGPLVMGACRGLNLLLPMAAVGFEHVEPRGLALVTTTLYIASVTHFGRDEAGVPRRMRLFVGGAGIIAAMTVLGSFAVWNASGSTLTLVLWLALAFHMTRMVWRSIRAPHPEMIRYAMKTFILGVIPLDATYATAAVGWPGGVIVLVLLLPSLVLGRWLYST